MKKISFWALTKGGQETASLLAQLWQKAYPQTEVATFFPEVMQPSLKEKIKLEFDRWDAHVFIMASGIVVRCIAPCLKSKLHDPAVIVGDEKGQYLVSLLSGHWGNANWLTKELARLSNATPVITTSTDVQGITSIEDLIKRLKANPESLKPAKKLNSTLANSGTLKVFWDNKSLLTTPLPLPERYEYTDNLINADLIFSNSQLTEIDPDKQLLLRIPYFALGIGCRKNISFHQLWRNLQSFLSSGNIAISAIKALCSITLKKNEPAIWELSQKLNLPLYFFEAEELKTYESEQNFSAFVKKTTGVGCICEPAAMKACQKPKLIIPKTSYPQTTFALAADISILSELDQVIRNT